MTLKEKANIISVGRVVLSDYSIAIAYSKEGVRGNLELSHALKVNIKIPLMRL